MNDDKKALPEEEPGRETGSLPVNWMDDVDDTFQRRFRRSWVDDEEAGVQVGQAESSAGKDDDRPVPTFDSVFASVAKLREFIDKKGLGTSENPVGENGSVGESSPFDENVDSFSTESDDELSKMEEREWSE